MISRKSFLKICAALPFGGAVLSACGLNINEEGKIVAKLTDNSLSTGSSSPLPKKGTAPEWNNKIWINSEPLKLSQLKDKVVLLEFWTFGCYNCQNVMPALKSWYDEYSPRGLVIVGMHAPEFDYEKKLENVQQAVKERGLKYPVAIDNDFGTWNKYGVRAWPTLYLVDKTGAIRFNHIGEGAYPETRRAIEQLLAEPGDNS